GSQTHPSSGPVERQPVACPDRRWSQPRTMASMRFLSPSSVGIVLILLVAGCGGSESADESPGDSAAADPETEVPIVSASPTSNNAGSADISLSGEGVSVSGTVPAILCG